MWNRSSLASLGSPLEVPHCSTKQSSNLDLRNDPLARESSLGQAGCDDMASDHCRMVMAYPPDPIRRREAAVFMPTSKIVSGTLPAADGRAILFVKCAASSQAHGTAEPRALALFASERPFHLQLHNLCMTVDGARIHAGHRRAALGDFPGTGGQTTSAAGHHLIRTLQS